MLVWIAYGLIVLGGAAILNRLIFNKRPASKATAWSLTSLVFLVSFAVLSAFKILMLASMDIETGRPLDLFGGLMGGYVFYLAINKRPRKKKEKRYHTQTNTQKLKDSKLRFSIPSLKKSFDVIIFEKGDNGNIFCIDDTYIHLLSMLKRGDKLLNIQNRRFNYSKASGSITGIRKIHRGKYKGCIFIGMKVDA